MIIDGKALAESILSSLKKEVEQLSFVPTLAVIQIGDNPASMAYIKQKQKAADAIGATVVFSHQTLDIRPEKLQEIITTYNNDKDIHGIIIQRPVPLKNIHPILHSVFLSKDIDGFLPNSLFAVPVALAVEEIVKIIYKSTNDKSTNGNYTNTNLQISRLVDSAFLPWLQSKNIIVIGRGETAGKPIATHFTKLGCNPTIIHSQTRNATEIIKSADIIISCVGKKRVITNENIKKGVMLISVGIWRDSEGKLHGDYDEEDIKEKASWYTPTPKGVGPVNVACLMQNLIKACTLQKGGNTL